MAILSGAMTVRRFRVVGEAHENLVETYRERLQEYAFRERPIEAGNKEEQQGWVLAHNLLDADFGQTERWLYNQYAVFSLRVDKKTLPANLFRATVEKRCEAWCRENEVTRCPKAVRTQIKDDLEVEWLKRAFPRVAVTEACWNINDGYLLLHSLSTTAGDRFQKLFYRTFALKLAPWSPLDWVGNSEVTSELLSIGPTHLQGESA